MTHAGRRIKTGNIVAVTMVMLAVFLATAFVVSYRPALMSLFALGWETGLTTSYEIHFDDGSSKLAEYTRPMSAVKIAGSDKGVQRILVSPVLKMNVPEEYVGTKATFNYRITVSVDGKSFLSRDYVKRYSLEREIPLGVVSLDSKDLSRFGEGVHLLSISVCDISIASERYSSYYAGCKTLLTFTILVEKGYARILEGRETPEKI